MQVLLLYSSIIEKNCHSFVKCHKFFCPHSEFMNYPNFLIYEFIIILSPLRTFTVHF